MDKWLLRICILIIFSISFMNLSGFAIAEDCQDIVSPGTGTSTPTSAGDAVYNRTMGTSMLLCFTWGKAYDISPICQEKPE